MGTFIRRLTIGLSCTWLAAAATSAQGAVIFSDNFNVSNNNNVPGWSECEDSSDDVAINNNSMRLRDNEPCGPYDGASATRGISTVGYESIQLTYKWAALTESEAGDQLFPQVSYNGGATWSNLTIHPLGGDGSFSTATFSLAATANNNSNFQIRFQTDVGSSGVTDSNVSSEGARIDDVLVEGTLVTYCTLFEDNFNRTASNTVGNGWVELENDNDDVAIVPGGVTGNALRLRDELSGNPDAAASQLLIGTVGHSSVRMSFYWKGFSSESNDYLHVAYTTNGTTWTTLGVAYALNDTSFGQETVTFPAGAANQAGFGIRLWTDVSSSNEGALIDNVVVQGNGTCGPPPDTTPPGVTSVNANDVVFDGDATVTATITDTESNVASATYELDYTSDSPGTCNACDNPTAMAASDGAFDELMEDVTATTTGDLFVGNYSACVVGTDSEGNSSNGTDCDPFAVTPGQLSIVYNGEYLDLNGSPTTMKATVTGPGACPIGAEVKFYIDDGSGGWLYLDAADTNGSGVAQITKTLQYGVFDVKVEVGDQDVGGTTAAECLGAIDDSEMIVVADPNASSTGGGFYMMNEHPSINGDSPRANFGYTAQRKFDRRLDDYVTTGNLLWMHKGHWRLKGKIAEGGKMPDGACPYSAFDVYPEALTNLLACAVFAGDGTLYEYNESYNPYCSSYLPCGQQWINPQTVEFMFAAYDGGSARECKGKGNKCKDVLKPDAFGLIAVEPDDISPSEGEFLIQLKGGNLVVR